MNKKLLVIGIAIIIAIVSKLLGGTWLVSLFLGFSIIILYRLNFLQNKALSNLIGAFILIIDSILLVLIFIPTQAYNINPTEFYTKRENYMKIYIKDPPSKTQYMAIMIRREQNNEIQRFLIKLSDYKKDSKIPLLPKDKIYFIGKKSDKSYAAIYLWDGSILRITPGTKLKLEKITKNLENLTNSQTKIKLESGNIWFHVIKLIKNSSNMQIETATGQMLIIRGTAGLVSKPDNKAQTYAIDYSHFIEIKNQKQSTIIKAGQGAIITNEKIYIIENLQKLLNLIGLDSNIFKTFPQLDKKDLENYKKQLINYIKTQIPQNIITKIESYKLKLFSIGDKNYKKYLENFETYQYLVGQTQKITNKIINNPNYAFIASNLNKQEAKIEYLYNQLKQNIENSDLYKTYIINLGIAGKIKNLSNILIQQAIQSKQYLNNLLNSLGK